MAPNKPAQPAPKPKPSDKPAIPANQPDPMAKAASEMEVWGRKMFKQP